MANPASELRSIFNEWHASAANESAHDARQFDGNPDVIAEHRFAMKLVWDISKTLERWASDGRNVEAYRNAVDIWTAYILAFPQGWTAAHTAAEQQTNAKLDVLEALADSMDYTSPSVPVEALDELSTFLDGIVALLSEDESIGDRLRGYVLELVLEIKNALIHHETLGVFDYQTALNRLWVALGAAQGESKSQKTKWKRFKENILAPAAVQFLVASPEKIMAAITTFTAGS